MTEITGISVVEASFKCNASCIIVLTRTGKSAQMIAKYRPRCPIFAVTRFEQVWNSYYEFEISLKSRNIFLEVFHWNLSCSPPANAIFTEIFIRSFTPTMSPNNGIRISKVESSLPSNRVWTVVLSSKLFWNDIQASLFGSMIMCLFYRGWL